MGEETKVYEIECDDGTTGWLVDARAIVFATEEEALAFCERCDLTPVEFYSAEAAHSFGVLGDFE